MRKQIARVLETNNKKITRTWREMLTSLQQPMMMKKGGQQIWVVYLDTTGIIIISRLNAHTIIIILPL